MRYSMSLFVLYFGTKRQYRDNNLVHHNIILSPRYKGLLNDIFNKKVLSDEFSLYLHMPTYTNSSLAPEGCETFYVLSPVPNLDADIDWTKAARPYRDAILKFLEENYLPDLRANIIAEHYIDPLHFQNTLNSYKGAAFSFPACADTIGLVPPAQPVRGIRQPVFHWSRNSSWRGRARGIVLLENRRRSGRSSELVHGQ